MSSDVPDWVRADCRVWGRQKRRVWEGKDWHGNIDGYAQSLLGRIREERDGAGQGTPAQRWPEVFWGVGLEVQRFLLGMPEMPYAVLHLHYVWNPDWNVTAKQKARALGIERDIYYNHLDRAEWWVWSRLDATSTCSYTQITEAVNKIVQDALQTASAEAINHQTSERCRREPNFAALNRTKISVKAR